MSLADGSASDIELDEDGLRTTQLVRLPLMMTRLMAITAPVNGLFTFDDDVATEWDGDDDYADLRY
ncbi:MAG: hypothetical protein ACLUIW_10300 [Dysosmobacter welbionis]